MDKHTGGKWLIHNTEQCKDNQLQSHDIIEDPFTNKDQLKLWHG